MIRHARGRLPLRCRRSSSGTLSRLSPENLLRVSAASGALPTLRRRELPRTAVADGRDDGWTIRRRRAAEGCPSLARHERNDPDRRRSRGWIATRSHRAGFNTRHLTECAARQINAGGEGRKRGRETGRDGWRKVTGTHSRVRRNFSTLRQLDATPCRRDANDDCVLMADARRVTRRGARQFGGNNRTAERNVYVHRLKNAITDASRPLATRAARSVIDCWRPVCL